MVLQGWEDPAGALSNKVRLTCVAAAGGDLKDSHRSDLFPLDVVTLWAGSLFHPLKLRGELSVGEQQQTVTPRSTLNLHRSYSKQRAAIEREYGQVWDSCLNLPSCSSFLDTGSSAPPPPYCGQDK